MFNANTKVVRHSFGIKDVPENYLASEAHASSQFFKNKVLMENAQMVDNAIEQKEIMIKNKDMAEKIVMQQIKESQHPMMINKLYKEGKEKIFQELLFEAFSNALVMDESFVVSHEGNLRALLESYIQKKGGYALLESSVSATKSPFLIKLKKACESISTKVTNRKTTSLDENITFTLNDEEKDELDLTKSNLSLDEISGLVKKKVLTVIQDEKQRQQAEEELERDIEADSGGDAAVAKESYIDKLPVEEGTLFNSLFRHSYKETLQENAAIISQLEEDDDDSNPDDYDVDSNRKDIQSDEFDGTRGTISDDVQNRGSVQSDIDMDLILAESLTKYTLMELMHTIQLESYTFHDLQKISRDLLNN